MQSLLFICFCKPANSWIGTQKPATVVGICWKYSWMCDSYLYVCVCVIVTLAISSCSSFPTPAKSFWNSYSCEIRIVKTQLLCLYTLINLSLCVFFSLQHNMRCNYITTLQYNPAKVLSLWNCCCGPRIIA